MGYVLWLASEPEMQNSAWSGALFCKKESIKKGKKYL
jgi:hypothetical protein